MKNGKRNMSVATGVWLKRLIYEKVIFLKNLSVNYLRTSCFIFSGSLCRFSLLYHPVRLQKAPCLPKNLTVQSAHI